MISYLDCSECTRLSDRYDNAVQELVAASFRMLEDFGFVASESVELPTVIGGILQSRKKPAPIKVGASGFTTA